MVEALKILILCVASAIFYGIVHDQFTARICVEYFTVFHPPVFLTQSPTLLAFGWGVIATWWVGAFLGLLLILFARSGSRPKLSASQLLKPIAKLLLVMAFCATVAGFTAYTLVNQGIVAQPNWISPGLDECSYARYLADAWAHTASYASGFIGGFALCVLQYRQRGFSRGISPAS